MENCKINLTHLHGDERADMVRAICARVNNRVSSSHKLNAGYLFVHSDAVVGFTNDNDKGEVIFMRYQYPEVTPEVFLSDGSDERVKGKDLAVMRKELDSYEPTPRELIDRGCLSAFKAQYLGTFDPVIDQHTAPEDRANAGRKKYIPRKDDSVNPVHVCDPLFANAPYREAMERFAKETQRRFAVPGALLGRNTQSYGRALRHWPKPHVTINESGHWIKCHPVKSDPSDKPTTEHTMPAAALMIKDIPSR